MFRITTRLAPVSAQFARPTPSLLSAISLTYVVRGMSTFARLTPQQVDELLRNRRATLVDVRNDDEVTQTGIIPSSVHVPLPYIDARHLGESKVNKIIFSCKTGKRAEAAAHKAASWGYNDVSLLEGAFNGWTSAGLNVSAYSIRPTTHAFFHEATSTCTYLVVDDATKEAAVIDPVLDYDPSSGRISSEAADQLLKKIKAWGLDVKYILDTHVHADHLTAAAYLNSKLPTAVVCMGAHIVTVQKTLAPKYNLDIPTDGSQFERLLFDGDKLPLGRFFVEAIHTPGHTPDHLTFIIGGSLYCGDTLFLPDVGSARCDFPNGSAKTLWASVQRLFSLPSDYDVYVGHDYPPDSRPVRFSTTIAEQIRENKHVKRVTSPDDFIRMRAYFKIPLTVAAEF